MSRRRRDLNGRHDERKVGKERAESDGTLAGAVLEVLATNYRHATR